ncbi:hypothetical protein ACKWTF_000654 [Chironomus riparius]
MRNTLTFVLILSIISTAHQSDYKVLKIEKCYGDNSSIVLNRCEYINGFLLNLNMEFVKPIDFIMFKLSIFKKNGNEFRELFKNIPPINWCKIMDGSSKLNSNMLVKISLMVVKEKFSEFYKKCPLGPITIEKINNTVDRRIIVMFPTGIYRIAIAWSTKKGDLLFDFSALLEIFN